MQTTKNFGSYYLKTKKTENIGPSVERADSWIVDDNIFYDADHDQVEEDGVERERD